MPDLLMEVRDCVARLTINRPAAMNSVTTGMWGEMADFIAGVERDPGVRCILLAGTGDALCSGADVKEASSTIDLDPAERARVWMANGSHTHRFFRALERAPQPVVARVRGFAAGGGMAMVAAADLAIASDNSRFLAAQIKLGVVPDAALGYNLVKSLGLKRAKQYALLGDIMDAQTALECGLVNWVVPDVELDRRTDELVARVTKLPRVAVTRAKAALNAAHRLSLADHLRQEADDIGECVAQEEFAARVKSFVERSRG